MTPAPGRDDTTGAGDDLLDLESIEAAYAYLANIEGPMGDRERKRLLEHAIALLRAVLNPPAQEKP